jgi:hypothetical protein
MESEMEENMQEQITGLSSQPSVAPTQTVKLWTPGFIAGVTFFLAFPAGIVLASINWLRMKMMNKAIIHLFAGAIGTIIFMTALLMAPGNAGRLIAIVSNLAVLFYLRWQMEKDINVFQATSRVEKAGWPGGCLIGVGVVVLYFMFGFVFTVVLVLLGVPMPD